MKIIAFPGGESSPPDETWLAELDAALSGEGEGPAADSWRELRDDVRSLASPASAELMERLEREFASPQHDSAQPSRRRAWLHVPASLRVPASLPVPAWLRGPAWMRAPTSLRAPARLRALNSLRALGRPQLAGAVSVVAALVVAVIVVGGGGSSSPGRAGVAQPATAGPVRSEPAVAKAPAEPSKGAAEPAREDLGPSNGPTAQASGATSSAASSAASGAAPGRVQQLAASISLSASPTSVQAVSDGVSQLAVRDEGFVASSHVQVQQHGASEATLTLRLPSARLSAALAAIGRLAQVSSESQSLQDITSTYDAARQRLSDARAERAALLRALAAATTEGQIDSLRERLAQARGAILQDQSSLNAVSRRASTAEVEVTVLGSSTAGSEGLTFHRGLHDAGRVLTVAAIVLLIALAVLVPLALVLVALMGAHRAWRRLSRERALR